MNKKFLLAAIAIPMAFTACTEDFETENLASDVTVLEDGKIRLGENFVLGVGRDSQGNESRSAYISESNVTQMYWIPKNSSNESLMDYSNGIPSDYVKDAVGLCYVNGNEILTNYKFDHDGWVKTGEDMTNTPWKCVGDVRYYSRNYLRFPGMDLNDAKIQTIKANTIYGAAEGVLENPVSTVILNGDEDVKIQNLNLARGIFKTEEKTIFAGDYVVYFPWSNAMLEAGNLTATSPVKMKYESGEYENRINALNKYTFMAGWLGRIDGGTEAAEMKLNQVSKLLGLKLHGVGDGYNKIVLLDPQGNFINKMELTIDQVKAGSASGTPVEKSQTIMIDFDTEIDGHYVNEHGEDHTIYVPMFETNIPAGTYVLAVNSNTGAAKAYQTTQAVDFTNVTLAKNLTSTCVTLSDFDYDVVTNETELIAANKTNSEKSILLLGDIELDEDQTMLKKDLVGYIGETKVGSLILPPTNEKFYSIMAYDRTFDCDVTVQAPGCCHTHAGGLYMSGITLNENRTIENQYYANFAYQFGQEEAKDKNYIYGTFNNTPYVTPDEEGLTYEKEAPAMFVQPKVSVYVYGEMNNNDADADGENIQSEIQIFSDDQTSGNEKNDGEIAVVANGKLTNNAWINNYGTMSNQTGKVANIMNNEGATYVLKIGGQLTGALLKNADNRRCDFIAEVDNAADSRWATAWSQGLANIIKIVKEQNDSYKSELDYVYPFQFTLNGGEVMTVDNKNVQVIVENPKVTFVGKKTTGNVDEFTPVSATIGRLLLNHNGKTSINFVSKKNNDGTYKTIEPLQLKVDASTWAGNECAAGEANNAINVLDGELQHNKYAYSGVTALKSIRLTVVGNFDVEDKYTEYAYLSQNGNLNANNGSLITLKEDSRFSIEGEIVSANADDSQEHGIIIEERVIGTLSKGNMKVEEKSYVQVAGDAVITVSKNVVNNGTMKWISRTGTKSPGIIYCTAFSASHPSNWVNGTPTIK